MPVFRYQALDPTSRRVRGIMRADSTHQARAQLLAQGLRTTRLQETALAPDRHLGSWGERLRDGLGALRQRDRILETFENLLTLLESHVPLEEAWDMLMRGQKRRAPTPAVWHQIHEAVRLGTPLWPVLERFPRHFDAADVALLRAGEETGELPAALERFIARRQMAGKLLSQFLGALAYPAFLLVFGSAVVIFLTTRVLPNLNSLLRAAGGQIPWPTRMLMVVGQGLSWGIVPLLISVILTIALAGRTQLRWRHGFILWLWRLPVLGRAWRDWQLAQFCLVLKTLLASGIHLPTALLLAGGTAGTGPIAQAAQTLRAQLLEGYDLSAPAAGAAQDPQGFPLWLWRALAVGQASGDLVPVLERVGQRFEHAATRSAARLAALVEPVMILAIGVMVGLVAYGALLPIIRLGGVW
jgi:general secretion pathway protein F